MKIQRILNLDGIRALSFLTVFGAHLGYSNVIPGGFGVTVFFFLSGYLITTILLKEYESRSTIAIYKFYLNRFYRIIPALYLAILISSVLSYFSLLGSHLTNSGLISQILHYSNYYIIFYGSDGIVAGTDVFWSLSVEEHYYFIFPILLLALLRITNQKNIIVVFLTLCICVLLWRIKLVSSGAESLRTYMATDTRLDSILWGSVLAVVKNSRANILKRSMKLDLLLTVIAASALLICFIYRDVFFRETYRYTIQGMALLQLFRVVTVYPKFTAFLPLESKLLVFIGKRSYSLYLYHHVAIHLCKNIVYLTSQIWFVIIATLITFLLAEISYRTVEMYYMNKKSKKNYLL